jgi:hypothetical protein
MKIIILMVVCLLFSMHPVQAQSEIAHYPDLAKIEIFSMDSCIVLVQTKYLGKKKEEFQQELTDYLRLMIRQYFPVLVHPDDHTSSSEHIGYIDMPITLILMPELDMVIYTVTSRFRYVSPCLEFYRLPSLGCEYREKISRTLKDVIKDLVERNAIAFYKLKGAIR